MSESAGSASNSRAILTVSENETAESAVGQLRALQRKHTTRVYIGFAIFIAGIVAIIVVLWLKLSEKTLDDEVGGNRGLGYLDQQLRRASALLVGNPRLRLPPMARLSQWAEADNRRDIVAIHRTFLDSATLRRISSSTERLPTNLKPLHYVLEIEPKFDFNGSLHDEDSYRGKVTILLHCILPTSQIVLHASKLNVSQNNVEVSRSDVEQQQQLKIKSITVDEVNDFLIIVPTEDLKNGANYTLTIHFNGSLGRDRGFYRYHYKENGQSQHLIVTFFEPTFAREAFPCFDEPAFKATFDVIIIRPQEYFSVSTMPKKSSVPKVDGSVADYFETTKPMSTYTLAFLIGNYSAQTVDKVTIYSTYEDAPHMNYSLHVAPKILAAFERTFNVSYPLPKLDMVSVPTFLADAMENWGLMVFQRHSLISDDNRKDPQQRIRPLVASVIAHEIAHQWFGNLVTMSWWNDVWLNEGFASYMQYVGVDAVEPTWNIMDLFLILETQPVMRMEVEMANPRPLALQDNDKTTDVDKLFDRITYHKGPSLIRMMEHFLTRPVFLKGIHSYLKKKSYSNAREQDLFEELGKAQVGADDKKVDVGVVMESWTRHSGFPLVMIIRNYSDGTATLTQHRHAAQNDDMSRDTTVWQIPLTFTSSDQRDFNRTWDVTWMKKSSMMLKGLPTSSEKWIIANLQGVGYYKVQYDAENWKLLTTQLNTDPKAIHPYNRATLTDDVLQLARVGKMRYDSALELVHYMGCESNYIPWRSFFSNLEYLDERLQKTNFYDKWAVKNCIFYVS